MSISLNTPTTVNCYVSMKEGKCGLAIPEYPGSERMPVRESGCRTRSRLGIHGVERGSDVL